jgi:hypothetical protein
MIPKTLNLTLTKGDTWEINFPIRNLIGSTIFAQIKNKGMDFSMSFNSTITTNNLLLSMSASNTNTLKESFYLYDVRVKRGSTIKTEYRGAIYIL